MLAVEPMLEESKDTYQQLFEGLKARGLQAPSLVVSDAHKGLIAAIRTSFIGVSCQRRKVHFMRNILAHLCTRTYVGRFLEFFTYKHYHYPPITAFLRTCSTASTSRCLCLASNSRMKPTGLSNGGFMRMVGSST